MNKLVSQVNLCNSLTRLSNLLQPLTGSLPRLKIHMSREGLRTYMPIMVGHVNKAAAAAAAAGYVR